MCPFRRLKQSAKSNFLLLRTSGRDTGNEHTSFQTQSAGMELSSQFDEIWSMVYMMQCLEMISVDEILDDEQGRVYFATSVGISL